MGLLVALIGPDGAGKSTLAQAMARGLAEAGHLPREVRVFHFRPGLVPNLRELLTGEKFSVPGDGIILPHTHPPSGPAGSLLRFLYYFFDYTAGYFFRVAPLLRRGGVAVFDRYYYDFIVDPRRSRIRPFPRLLRLSRRLVPRPDFTFLLIAPVETMRNRKPELTREELEEQVRDYRSLLPLLRNAGEVSTGAPPEETVRVLLGRLQDG